jgi:uncharacterized protein YceH (UPF0502 family)
MDIRLSDLEARLIGCLIEKEITTPDQYPLSLNALLNACNQKSNRDPVLALDERDVQGTVDALARRHLVVEKSGFGSRVPKYQHRFCNTEYGTLKFTAQELAILCELLLRGPQTPGELRTRAARMAPLADAADTEQVLATLAARSDGPFVMRLPREAGRRDARYAHLFGDPERLENAIAAQAEQHAVTASHAATPVAGGVTHEAAFGALEALEARLAEIEQRVAELEAARLA